MLSFLNGQSGIFLGFIGIAFTYFVTAFTERLGKKPLTPALFVIGGITSVYFAVSAGDIGVVNVGNLLGYEGIGAGLICGAVSMHATKADKIHWRAQSILVVIGLCFQLLGLLMIVQAHLLRPDVLLGYSISIALLSVGIFVIKPRNRVTARSAGSIFVLLGWSFFIVSIVGQIAAQQ